MIESTRDIRKGLGKHLDTIKKLDPWGRERRRTKLIKKKLLQKHDNECGYCIKNVKLVAAHIMPLEIGASTTEDNIILLCNPCHKDYDNGHMSINAMSIIAKEWRKGIPPSTKRKPLSSIHPPKPITPPPASLRTTSDTILELQRKRWYYKAIKMINKILENNSLNSTEQIYLQIKRAELFRRRSANGVVDKALKYLLEIDSNKIPTKYIPVYYYELSYVHHIMGDHAEAIKASRDSAKVSLANSSGSHKVDYVAAMANELLCKMTSIEKLTKKQAKFFLKDLKELQTKSEKCGEYWGGRWALNCAAHGLQVLIKSNDMTASWKSLDKLKNLYFDSDVTNGWDSGGLQTLSLLDGLVHVLFPRSDNDINTGVGLLARSFMTRGYRQRPEGIRDVGFGLAIGLCKTKKPNLIKTAKLLESLMQKTVDGTSVIWPYKKI